jgi:hypothetical protein
MLEAASATCAVNEYDPLVVGVPLIAPLEDMLSPGGSAPPLTDQP